MNDVNMPEPPPIHNESVPIWDLVIADMRQRDNLGLKKYGTALQTNNGRDALVDAYQEALDLAVYLRQAIEERNNLSIAKMQTIIHENATRQANANATGWPPTDQETVYEYCFSTWPVEENPRTVRSKVVVKLFRHLRTRVVLEFTESQFRDFRESLFKAGLQLLEVERCPHLEPEPVF